MAHVVIQSHILAEPIHQVHYSSATQEKVLTILVQLFQAKDKIFSTKDSTKD